MPRAPDFAHAAAPEQLHELVAAHLLRAAQPASDPVQDVRRQRCDDGARKIGHVEDERGRQRR
ncbi:MAG: hypothetical protein DMF99_15805 [Acidobacteria bacterium]|nr:MAG: hypothetical protein DMF99_15805 [Acidobacteriota bacterium]